MEQVLTRALGGTLMWILCDWAEMTLSLDWSQSPGSGGIQVKPAHQPSGSASFYTQGSVFLRSKQTVVVSLVALILLPIGGVEGVRQAG